jgi:hypothetical protein
MSQPANRNITSFPEVNTEVGIIYRTITKLQSSSSSSGVTILTGSTGGSGGSSTPTTNPNRSGLMLLAVGSNFVPFLPDIGTSDYNLILWGYGTDGYDVGINRTDVTSLTSGGFYITASQIYILEWVAIPHT